MRTHEFMSECPGCGEITFWRKANERGDHPDDPVRRGFRCGECGEFLEVVEDTRGKAHTRDDEE